MSQLPGRLRADHARERWPADWYIEPAWAVEKLFQAVPFEGAIHDPCAGSGRIPSVAKSFGYTVTAADLHDRGYPGTIVKDYFKDRIRYDNIVSNPPYKLGEEFIHHALEFTRHKIAVIMRLPFLASQGRYNRLYKTHPPSEVLVLSKRPSMPPGGTDIPAKGGTDEYAFLVWDQGYVGPTILKWAL
jgi:hypothetical protein